MNKNILKNWLKVFLEKKYTFIDLNHEINNIFKNFVFNNFILLENIIIDWIFFKEWKIEYQSSIYLYIIDIWLKNFFL